jgi:putative acetyltransferase
MIAIRKEEPADAPEIRHVVDQAFGQSEEADIVEALRRRGAVTLFLVAVRDDRVIGHILFSPVTIESERSGFEAIGLGPMAVLPTYQNQGIGSQLARRALQECRDAGHEIVVVLGHPAYYPRFGFVPAIPLGIRWELETSEGAFMVLELRDGALAGRTGVVRYQPEFTSA